MHGTPCRGRRARRDAHGDSKHALQSPRGRWSAKVALGRISLNLHRFPDDDYNVERSEHVDPKITRIRAQIQAGTYLTPAKLDIALDSLLELLSLLPTSDESHRKITKPLVENPPGTSTELTASLVSALRKCRVGAGAQFRDISVGLICRNLGDIVDREYVRTEFPLPGGRGDAELPVCTENLTNYPLWADYQRRYDIRSIIIEAKNTRKQASTDSVAEIAGNIRIRNRGRFGFLISRSGFSKGAYRRLAAIAASSETLIIPLAKSDLEVWSALQRPTESMRFLRRKETELLQAS